ncbi:hypothetical protein D3C72_1874370 [compost metagenome]
MIGEWLKENTMTGIASHRVMISPWPIPVPAPDRETLSKMAVDQLGIRYRASSISTPTNGNTRMLMVFTIACSPKRTMVIRPTIRISDRMARGGDVIPNW